VSTTSEREGERERETKIKRRLNSISKIDRNQDELLINERKKTKFDKKIFSRYTNKLNS